MAPPLRPLSATAAPGVAAGVDWLRWAPGLTVAIFAGPVIAGLVGTLLPSIGWLPALGGERATLAPWRALLADPSLPGALRLTLTTGAAATLISFLLVVLFCATCHGTRLYRGLCRMLAPLLAVPHAAVAIGLAFLIAPSGWLARLVSPWATGWTTPPDLATVQDPWGAALIAGLVIKEVPYLLLMTLGALGQVRAEAGLALARSLGYRPAQAWLKVVLPQIYPQLRLPVYAVLAYALSVVDMALILGPGAPPPLAPLVLRWFNDPDLALRFKAAAGATLQLAVAVGAILLWAAGERLVAWLARPWLADGRRGPGGVIGRAAAGGAMAALYALAGLGLAGMALWSVAARWRYPDSLPSAWTLENWSDQLGGLAWPTWTTLATALAAALAALALALACLENEQRRGLKLTARGLWLLYTPLLVPQISFLFGAQVWLVAFGLDGGWLALAWSHLLFVLPYLFLSLADPYRALDVRYARTARGLGASSRRVFWRIKLPMLARPVLFALAIGFSVSVALYLPTLFAGGGRHATLTTEAVSLAAGADRRAIGVLTFVQSALPLFGFGLALAMPARLGRPRRRWGRT